MGDEPLQCYEPPINPTKSNFPQHVWMTEAVKYITVISNPPSSSHDFNIGFCNLIYLYLVMTQSSAYFPGYLTVYTTYIFSFSFTLVSVLQSCPRL